MKRILFLVLFIAFITMGAFAGPFLEFGFGGMCSNNNEAAVVVDARLWLVGLEAYAGGVMLSGSDFEMETPSGTETLGLNLQVLLGSVGANAKFYLYDGPYVSLFLLGGARCLFATGKVWGEVLETEFGPDSTLSFTGQVWNARAGIGVEGSFQEEPRLRLFARMLFDYYMLGKDPITATVVTPNGEENLKFRANLWGANFPTLFIGASWTLGYPQRGDKPGTATHG